MGEQDFVGKVAIVTGGSMGMGRAVARRLALGGAKLVGCGRRQEAVERAVAGLRGEGLEVCGLAADVGRAEDVRRVVEQAVTGYGGVDVLVNSAGIQRYGTVVDTDESTWDEVF